MWDSLTGGWRRLGRAWAAGAVATLVCICLLNSALAQSESGAPLPLVPEGESVGGGSSTTLVDGDGFLMGGPKEWTSPRGLSSALQIMLLLTVLSMAPAILLMTTSFIRIVVVLGLLRQALGTQQLPPSQ